MLFLLSFSVAWNHEQKMFQMEQKMIANKVPNRNDLVGPSMAFYGIVWPSFIFVFGIVWPFFMATHRFGIFWSFLAAIDPNCTKRKCIFSWFYTLCPTINCIFSKACSKIIWFSKFLHWEITNSLKFFSKKALNFRDLTR